MASDSRNLACRYHIRRGDSHILSGPWIEFAYAMPIQGSTGFPVIDQ